MPPDIHTCFIVLTRHQLHRRLLILHYHLSAPHMHFAVPLRLGDHIPNHKGFYLSSQSSYGSITGNDIGEKSGFNAVAKSSFKILYSAGSVYPGVWILFKDSDSLRLFAALHDQACAFCAAGAFTALGNFHSFFRILFRNGIVRLSQFGSQIDQINPAPFPHFLWDYFCELLASHFTDFLVVTTYSLGDTGW